MKTTAQKRPAERPEDKVISMARLLRARRTARGEGLSLKILIPGEVLPLFNALAATLDMEPQAFAVYALCKGLTSEDVLGHFDKLVNELL